MSFPPQKELKTAHSPPKLTFLVAESGKIPNYPPEKKKFESKLWAKCYKIRFNSLKWGKTGPKIPQIHFFLINKTWKNRNYPSPQKTSAKIEPKKSVFNPKSHPSSEPFSEFTFFAQNRPKTWPGAELFRSRD